MILLTISRRPHPGAAARIALRGQAPRESAIRRRVSGLSRATPRFRFAPIRGRDSGFACGAYKQATGGERAARTPKSALAVGLTAGCRWIRTGRWREPTSEAVSLRASLGWRDVRSLFPLTPFSLSLSPSKGTPRCRGRSGQLLEEDISFFVSLSLSIYYIHKFTLEENSTPPARAVLVGGYKNMSTRVRARTHRRRGRPGRLVEADNRVVGEAPGPDPETLYETSALPDMYALQVAAALERSRTVMKWAGRRAGVLDNVE